MKTQIIFEDKDILVIRKPAGIATQTGQLSQADVVSELKNYLGNNPYLGVIHRLDQPVEGILVFAKTPQAAKGLSQQLQAETFHKDYLTLILGTPQEKQGVFIDYLLKDEKGNTSKVVDKSVKDSKYAELGYEYLESTEFISLLQIKLKTGRHHQIRVQMAHHGMSILGDQKYAKPETKEAALRLGITQLALCAYRLEFKHPVTKKNLQFQIEPTWISFVKQNK